jgi:hypothetical protein
MFARRANDLLRILIDSRIAVNLRGIFFLRVHKTAADLNGVEFVRIYAPAEDFVVHFFGIEVPSPVFFDDW